MKKILSVLLVLAMLLSMVPAFANEAQSDIKGSLVIVGGALRSDNDAVFEAFIERAGGKEKARIGVVPAASGQLNKYAKMFIEDMTSRGLDASQVVVLPLATRDDRRTADVDESLWITNGSNPEVVEMVKGLTGVWFVGGDQLRITQVLLNSDGSNTPVLDAMWDIYRAGAVIGGTSAGAAIMSEVMIAGGDSLSALAVGYVEDFDSSTLDYQNSGGLVVTKGLGFFKEGVIDQHFDRKARLGRLAVVLFDNKAKFDLGFGVEENAAMIYDNLTGKFSVAGTGGVVILDASKATKDATLSNYDGFSLTYVEGNDIYDVKNAVAEMDDSKYTTVGYEYMYTDEVVWGGSLGANQRLRDFIAFDLMDNEAKTEISTYLFGSGMDGFRFDFYQTEDSEGYWGQSGAADLYSFENVMMRIVPVGVHITEKVAQAETKPVAKPEVTPTEVASQAKEHVVKAGEVLWKIAQQYGVTLDALVSANALKNPNFLSVGQTLIIPSK